MGSDWRRVAGVFLRRRHVGEVDADVVVRQGDSAQQDDRSSRSAEPAVQGDVHVPSAARPAGRRHAHGRRERRAQSQATTGNDRMVFAG